MQNMSWRLAALVALALAPSVAAADDWVVTKLRGSAAVLIGEKWQPLRRGDVVSDDRAIQTLSSSKATLERGPEKIELGPETAIRIDEAATARYTTVKQYFGAVTVEAEVQNVEHFGVLTPHLAAVVKGTRFTMVSDETTATVEVLRGHVAVEDSDTHQTTVLGVGQSASTSEGGAPLSLSGEGTLPPVYAANGKPITHTRPAKSDGQIVSPRAAATAAREAALAAGATRREADKAAKAAGKAAEKEAEGKGADGGSSRKGGESGSDGGKGHGGKSDDGNSGSGISGGSSAASDGDGGSGGGGSGDSSGGDHGNSGDGGGKKDKD
jgi:hypothetical protein